MKGNDALLRDRVVDDLVVELLDGDDRTLALEDHTVPGRAGAGDGEEGGGGAEAREAVVAAVLNAASSPPFMTARRIVVVREAGALTAADADVIGRYLDAPLDTSVIVLVSGGGTIPAALTKKLKEVGAGERAPDSEKTSDVLASAARGRERAAASGRGQARRRAPRRGRRPRRFVHRRAALGLRRRRDARCRRRRAVPRRSRRGARRSSSRTRSKRATAPARSKCCTGCSMHRTRAMPARCIPSRCSARSSATTGGCSGSTTNRCTRAPTRSPRSAVGSRSSRPARRSSAARSLGTDGIRQAFDALHQADLDIKGARGIPPDAVVEVLVVRLARLSRASGRGAGGRRR